MSLETARGVLLWCSILNYGLLLVWAGVTLLARGPVHRLWRRWFRLTPEQFDMLNFAGLTLYKTGIILFNIVPYIALRIVRG